jgi:hypothetical protein
LFEREPDVVPSQSLAGYELVKDENAWQAWYRIVLISCGAARCVAKASV